jgi:hypothetical protein
MLVPQLQERFPGRVVAPDDPGYDQARTPFYGGVDKHPAAIVRPTSADEIAELVRFARAHGVELSVRSGAHSIAGDSISEGGLTLDLTAMKGVDIDTVSGTAWAETGLTAAELTAVLDEHDLVLGFGDTGSVGIGGITLCGGIGFLLRKFGMAIDNVLAAEIVTADGRILTVDEDNHPDLFWAIRGGGGNYGVVSRFRYRLHPLGDAFGGMLMLPATPEVVSGFMDLAASDELSTILNVMSAPPMPFIPAELHGRLVCMALLMYAGDPARGDELVGRFRALATPIADMTKPMRYREMFFPEDDSYHPTAVSLTMFLDTVDTELAETILEQLAASDAPLRAVQLRALGGAMARVAPEATAFAHRQAPIMANVAAFYETPQTKPRRRAWVDALAKQLNQGNSHAYVGFVASVDEHPVADVYPAETLARLREVKQQYDPDNFFRLNYNVAPAGG